MSISVTAEHYGSCDGKNKIVYTKWSGDPQPKAVLQLVHGMAEYIDRYDEFARFMVGEGFVVYGADHLGHGRSAANEEDLGYFAHKDGWKLLVEDAHALTLRAKKENPGLPFVLLGHSMGSMVVRSYANRYSADIDALIIMGTAGKNPLGGVGIFLVNLLTVFKGERHRSKFIDKMGFGSYNKTFSDVRTPMDWLSADRDNVARYIADEKCGFLFTLAGYRDLFTLLNSVNVKSWGEGIRKDLPVLVISGRDDPVGGYGKGVEEVYRQLKEKGVADVTLSLWDGLRHEILNETDKQPVYDAIAGWTAEKL